MNPFTILFIAFFVFSLASEISFFILEKKKPSISRYFLFALWGCALLDFVFLILFFRMAFASYDLGKAIFTSIAIGLFIASIFFIPFSNRLGKKIAIASPIAVLLLGIIAFLLSFDLSFIVLGL